jgi:hypothetical protein
LKFAHDAAATRIRRQTDASGPGLMAVAPRLLSMKRILLMTVAVLAGMVAINAARDHANNCDCLDDCWCKTTLGRHARWWVPARYHSLRSSSG